MRVRAVVLFIGVIVGAASNLAAPGVASASSVKLLPADGSFVSYAGAVYSVAGHGLVRVHSWDSFGGPRPVTRLSRKQFDDAPEASDGAFIRSLPDRRVYELIAGAPVFVSSWAAVGGVHAYADVDGLTVAAALAGRDLSTRGSLAGHITDGTRVLPRFVRTADGRVYSLAGGAPIYVSSWAVYSGRRPTLPIDAAAIAHAGSGAWTVVRRYPADFTQLAAIGRPGQQVTTFVVSGGAPVYVPTTKNMAEGFLDMVRVDARAIELAGGPAPYDRLRAQPADGHFLIGAISFDVQHLQGESKTYWTAGGAAIPVRNDADCASVPGFATSRADTDDSAIQKAGTGGVYNHLAPVPADPPATPC